MALSVKKVPDPWSRGSKGTLIRGRFDLFALTTILSQL